MTLMARKEEATQSLVGFVLNLSTFKQLLASQADFGRKIKASLRDAWRLALWHRSNSYKDQIN